MTTAAQPRPLRRPRIARIGPYARITPQKPRGELTEEGRRVLCEWIERWPRPEGLLAKVYRSSYWAAVQTFDPEELRGICLQGLTRAMISYDPAQAQFSTYAAGWLRQSVQAALKSANKARRNGMRQVGSGTADGGSVLDGLPAPSLASAIQERDVRDQVQAILRRRIRNPQHLEIFCLRHGLLGRPGMTLHELGNRFGLSREWIRQIETKVLRAIRIDLEKLHRVHAAD